MTVTSTKNVYITKRRKNVGVRRIKLCPTSYTFPLSLRIWPSAVCSKVRPQSVPLARSVRKRLVVCTNPHDCNYIAGYINPFKRTRAQQHYIDDLDLTWFSDLIGGVLSDSEIVTCSCSATVTSTKTFTIPKEVRTSEQRVLTFGLITLAEGHWTSLNLTPGLLTHALILLAGIPQVSVGSSGSLDSNPDSITYYGTVYLSNWTNIWEYLSWSEVTFIVYWQHEPPRVHILKLACPQLPHSQQE